MIISMEKFRKNSSIFYWRRGRLRFRWQWWLLLLLGIIIIIIVFVDIVYNWLNSMCLHFVVCSVLMGTTVVVSICTRMSTTIVIYQYLHTRTCQPMSFFGQWVQHIWLDSLSFCNHNDGFKLAVCWGSRKHMDNNLPSFTNPRTWRVICIETTSWIMYTPHCPLYSSCRQGIGLRARRYITPQCGNTFIAGDT